MSIYYQDENVTLYHGDCLTEHREWLDADVLVTDPPYGRAWRQGQGLTNSHGRGKGSKSAPGIAGDQDTGARDAALSSWHGPGIVFGDPLIAQPSEAVQALVYHKGIDAGVKGARAGYRRDVEMIYLVGPWPVGVGGSTSVLHPGTLVAGPTAPATRLGHPHSKPIALMELLIERCPPGVIADPFTGSGATLVAARNLGRKAIGVELEERYCEVIAKRLAQGAFDFGEAA